MSDKPMPPHQTGPTLDSGCLALQKLIRFYARRRFQTMLQVTPEAVTDGPLPPGNALVHGYMQAIVLLASRDLRVTFKAHFNRTDVQALLQRLSALTSSAARQQERIQDFFREYANLTAGGIKGELQHRGIECGISLPVITSGLDELFFNDRVTDRCATDAWSVVATGATFVCTSTIDLADPAVVNGLDFNEAFAVAGGGSIEFL